MSSFGGVDIGSFQRVTDAADGVDERRRKAPIHLLADVIDGDFDDVAKRIEVFVPNLLSEPGAGDNFVGVAQKTGEYGEFPRRERKAATGASDSALLQIEHQITSPEADRIAGCIAP